MIFCNYEGQIEQNSDFESRKGFLLSAYKLLNIMDCSKAPRSKSFIRLYEHLRNQIISDRIIDASDERCIAWMYLRSWGPSACHSLIDKLTEFITEDDYNSALLNIMKGPDEHSGEGEGTKDFKVYEFHVNKYFHAFSPFNAL